MILICYDGSADARAAVEQAARLFPNQPATVLTAWQTFVEVVARTTVGFGLVPSIPDPDEIDEASQNAAEQTPSPEVAVSRSREVRRDAASDR